MRTDPQKIPLCHPMWGLPDFYSAVRDRNLYEGDNGVTGPTCTEGPKAHSSSRLLPDSKGNKNASSGPGYDLDPLWGHS